MERTQEELQGLYDKLAERLHEEGYEGTDVSPEISLYEYGLLAHQNGRLLLCSPFSLFDNTYPDIDSNMFYETNWSESDFEEYRHGMLSFVGMSEDEWKQSYFVHKIFDMEVYSGHFSQDKTTHPYYAKSLRQMLDMPDDED